MILLVCIATIFSFQLQKAAAMNFNCLIDWQQKTKDSWETEKKKNNKWKPSKKKKACEV